MSQYPGRHAASAYLTSRREFLTGCLQPPPLPPTTTASEDAAMLIAEWLKQVESEGNADKEEEETE